MKTLRLLKSCLVVMLSLGLALGACSGDDDDPGTDAGTDAAIEDGGGEEDGSSGTDEDLVLDDEMSWSMPEELDQTDETTGSVALAVSSSGDYQVVWSEQVVSGGDEAIVGRLFDGTSWSAAQNLSENGFSCDNPVVDFGAGGRAVMIYERYATGMAVWGNVSDGQVTWGTEEELYSGGTSIPGDLDMGGPVGVWSLAAMGSASVWSTSHLGANWSEAAQVGDSSLDGDAPRVAADTGGNGFAVWCTGNTVYVAEVTGGDQWGAPVELYNGSAEVGDAEVAVDGSGNAVAVWRWQSGSNRYIEAATYTPGGGWEYSGRLSSGGRAAGAEPVVAMDASGNAIAAWDENDGPDRWIFASRYVPGTGWSADEAIGRQPKDAEDPAIGMNASGKAVVVWNQEVGDSTDIWSARYLPEPGGWMEAVAVFSDEAWEATFPKVAVDATGQAVAVWNVKGPDTVFNVMGAVLK